MKLIFIGYMNIGIECEWCSKLFYRIFMKDNLIILMEIMKNNCVSRFRDFQGRFLNAKWKIGTGRWNCF